MRKRLYPDSFIEQAVIKVHSRGEGRTIRDVAEELNVGYVMLRNWVARTSVGDVSASAGKEKRPQDWKREEQFAALLETHGMGEEALQAWCRERGLYPHHLDSWRTDFVMQEPAVPAPPQTVAALRKENDKLKADLRRKEKALAEAAALLVLQKKFQALWADEEK